MEEKWKKKNAILVFTLSIVSILNILFYFYIYTKSTVSSNIDILLFILKLLIFASISSLIPLYIEINILKSNDFKMNILIYKDIFINYALNHSIIFTINIFIQSIVKKTLTKINKPIAINLIIALAILFILIFLFNFIYILTIKMVKRSKAIINKKSLTIKDYIRLVNKIELNKKDILNTIFLSFIKILGFTIYYIVLKDVNINNTVVKPITYMSLFIIIIIYNTYKTKLIIK